MANQFTLAGDKDMDKDFLAFWDNTVLTTLKNDPEGCTSSASTTVDLCMPQDTYILDDFGFMPDMLNDFMRSDLMLHEAHSIASFPPTTRHVGNASGLYNPTMSTVLNMDLAYGHGDLGLDRPLKNLICEDDTYPLISDDLLLASASSLSFESAVGNNNGRYTSTVEKMQDGNFYSDEDVRSSSGLVKFFKTEVLDSAASRQKQFYSENGPGAGLMDGSLDFWGSISNVLRQRYNSDFPTKAEEDVNVCKTKGVKRSEVNVTSAPLPLKRRKQEELAKHGASDSVLMNLLVSGCDRSAGYSCFTPPKPKNATSVASSKLHSSCFRNRASIRLDPAETFKVINQASRYPEKYPQNSQALLLECEKKTFQIL